MEAKYFTKTTTTSGSSISIDGSQKAALNRKGNMLFNSGSIEDARRVFITTGYSDGLVRVGDYYQGEGRFIDALQMYRLAPDRKKYDAIIQKIAGTVQQLLKNDSD
jgi:hypothetical protein